MQRRGMIWWMGGVLFLVLMLAPSFGQLEITEVMYAPPSDGVEWVEIFNNGSFTVNLSQWKFGDGRDNDSFSCCSFLPACNLFLAPNSVALLTDRNTTLRPENVTQFCVDDTVLGYFGLNNTGEGLVLFNATHLDGFVYSKSMGAYLNNKTLEKVSGVWRESIFPFGTPGKRNGDAPSPPPYNPALPEENDSDSGTAPNIPSHSCDIALSLSLITPLFFSEKISFSLLVKNNTNSPANISVQGKIEMPDGKKEKEYSPWSSDKLSGEMEKSYAPSLSAGMHLISFWLVNSSCNDTDESNNNAVRLIAVLGSSSDFEEGKNTDSSLEIEEVSVGKDEFAAWGESIPVKIEIYKGNTSKTLVELKAKKAGKLVSETSKVYVQEKFSALTATIPLQLRCASGEGEATVFLEGLGATTEKKFMVKGNFKRCEEMKYENAEESEVQTEEENENQEDNENSEENAENDPLKNLKKYNLTFLQLPEMVAVGEKLSFKVKIQNDHEEHRYHLWAYLYRGNRCYSCAEQSKERNESIKSISLASGEEKEVAFLLPVDGSAEAGEYKVKVKLLKDEQKTAKELTADILLGEKEKLGEGENKELAGEKTGTQESLTGASVLPLQRKTFLEKNKGITIYQTPDAKTIEIVPIILAMAFALVIVVMMGNSYNRIQKLKSKKKINLLKKL